MIIIALRWQVEKKCRKNNGCNGQKMSTFGYIMFIKRNRWVCEGGAVSLVGIYSCWLFCFVCLAG